MKRSAEKHQIVIQQDDTEHFDSFLIPDEKSVDSIEYLKICEQLVLRDGSFIHGFVRKIVNELDSVSVHVSDQIIRFDKIIIAAGAWSDSLINRSEGITIPGIRCFNDVGSALLVQSQFPHVPSPRIDRIIRTPNRGGTCGIHCSKKILFILVRRVIQPNFKLRILK